MMLMMLGDSADAVPRLDQTRPCISMELTVLWAWPALWMVTSM